MPNQRTDSSYFASMCEAMAATLSLLPSSIAPAFDRVAVVTSDFLDASTAAHSEASPIFHPEREDAPTPFDLSRPVRFGLIADLADDDDPERRSDAGYFGMHVHRATRPELRGVRLPFLSPFPHLRMTLAIMPPYKRATEHTHGFISYHARERMWLRWGPGIVAKPNEDMHQRIAMLVSMQFSARYDWKVLIAARPGAPRIALACKPEAARQLFRARDLPPGRQRRAALRHWVTEHFRRIGTPAPVGVRSHFRGAEAFDWEGLHCEVEPSEYDRDRVGEKPDPSSVSARKPPTTQRR